MQHHTSRLNIHRVLGIDVGIFPTAFDKVVNLSGFHLQPDDDTGYIWKFRDGKGRQGRLLHVEGCLGRESIFLSGKARAYLMTHRRPTLGLAFSQPPQPLWLTPANHKELTRTPRFPPTWEQEMVKKVIRSRLRKVHIIDESHFLAKIKTPGRNKSA